MTAGRFYGGMRSERSVPMHMLINMPIGMSVLVLVPVPLLGKPGRMPSYWRQSPTMLSREPFMGGKLVVRGTLPGYLNDKKVHVSIAMPMPRHIPHTNAEAHTHPRVPMPLHSHRHMNTHAHIMKPRHVRGPAPTPTS